MTAPTACKDCGTMLDTMSIPTHEAQSVMVHDVFRCRDVIRGQRDEAIRVGLKVLSHPILVVLMNECATWRAALEKLRGK